MFIPWPVASCQSPVGNCQLSVVKVIGVVRAIGCLDSQVRAQTCLPWSVTHAEYVTSGSTWPEVTTCHEDSSLIGEPNTCLSLIQSTFIPIFNSCIYLPVMHMPEQSPQFQFKLSLPLSLSIELYSSMALARLLSHRLSKDTHSGWRVCALLRFLPTKLPVKKSVKDVRRLETRKRLLRALTRTSYSAFSPFSLCLPINDVSTDVSG